MKFDFSYFKRGTGFVLTAMVFGGEMFGQARQAGEPNAASGGWFWIIVIAMLGIAGAFFAWWRFQKKQETSGDDSRAANYYNSSGSYEMDGLEVDKGMEWLRKAERQTLKAAAAGPESAKTPQVTSSRSSLGPNLDTNAFQERMRKLQYARLPINSFVALKPAKLYEPLQLSEDASLLNAVDQANEEFEEDESVREVAIKVLAAFCNRNSVEALTQMALYDLSSNLRSKAVSVLTDFDHPSVFEAILLACADPTREVRAAAARGLFRLSFDRADAWMRIMETNDEFRMRQSARAAIESGIAAKSLDRLVHEDMKVAYEAFALAAFTVASGETAEIFKAIETHKDERIRFALLHVVKVVKDERTIAELERLAASAKASADVVGRIRETIESFDAVPA